MRILSLLFLTSCFTLNESALVQGPSPKKQRQKIAVLQKKLQGAEKEQKKVQSQVETLAQAIDEAEISLIRRQIDDYERKGDKSNLFLQEREALHRMIQSGPSPSAFEAQVELDRILRLITEESDGISECFKSGV
jgi:t-SNARE complex subunit (syntaxin)